MKIQKNITDNFTFTALTESEMSEVRGGTKPKSRDKDIYDYDED